MKRPRMTPENRYRLAILILTFAGVLIMAAQLTVMILD
jgi:hypothetical protein